MSSPTDGGAAEAAKFSGWSIVGIAFVAQFLANAVTLSAFGNFVRPLSEAFNVERSTIGFGLSIAVLTLGVAGPFVGRWLDRGLARRMMSIGALVSGLGLLLLSRTQTLAQFGLVFIGLVCMGAAFFGVMPSMVLVANWFVRRRGLALGLTVAGATLSSYVAPASAQYLIDGYGWRTAVAAFGVFTIVVAVPLFGFMAVGRPEDIGQLPDGDAAVQPEPEEGEQAEATSGDEVIETGALFRDQRLWLLAVGFGLVMTSPIVLIGALVPFGTDLGFTEQQANVFFLAMMPCSILGKVVVGGLADMAPIKPSILMVVLVNILVWMIFYTEPSYSLFIVTGAIYGIGIGGASPLQGVAMGLCFGRANFGRASGIGGIAMVPLLALASAASQVLLRETGSYHAGFLLQIGLLCLGGVLLMIVKLPNSPAAANAAAA
ncbi:MAG: MFS transporter [Myxococcota bacterium]